MLQIASKTRILALGKFEQGGAVHETVYEMFPRDWCFRFYELRCCFDFDFAQSVFDFRIVRMVFPFHSSFFMHEWPQRRREKKG